MENPRELRYTKEHEWVKIEGDTATMGISDYAQHALTDIVYVELPKEGREFKQFESIAVVESVKSVSDVYAPLSGKVTELNKAVTEKPELVNKEPFTAGWLFRFKAKDLNELNNLMTAEQYDAYLASLKH
ncbi:MAG: glycine cleavage system protein GcvH [Candidatus Diapherotrites archaeon]|uniref:Probable glycine cleavage system H protein n=1 Tax=Candidatus Iainarchaeum sp. TaxID=3101447 RepID=A0A8T4L9K5_9ARCH|nr:glycine cleavage system protein GcvH [Candidatus Diapherotrites archaeon]